MAQQGILWQLVSGFNPGAAYTQGLQQYNQQQNILQQLAGQDQDRQFRRDESTRNQQNTDRQFNFGVTQADRQQANADRAYNAQRQDTAFNQTHQNRVFGLQEQTANTAQIVMVEQPDGSKIPVRIDRQGNATPINVGVQQQASPSAFPPAPAGLDAKTWRVEQTKSLVKNLENAPQAIRKANEMLATVDNILADPALDYSTGIYSPLQKIPATGPYRFGTKAQQIQGQAFLQAFESLKGGGQITEVEGTKATQAIGRLNTAQNAKDYRDALNDLREVLISSVQRQQSLLQRYQQDPSNPNPQATTNPPQPNQPKVQINSQAEYERLPSGSLFIMNGKSYQKP